MTGAENVTGVVAHHGEGPVWSPSWGGLRFLDLLAGDLLTLTDSGVSRRHVGKVAAAVRPRRSGGFVVALERGLALADSESAELRLLPEIWTDASVRFNDGGCGPDGSLYVGSTDYDGREGAGRLYRVDTSYGVEALAQVSVSNGVAFSADGDHAYYVDSSTRRIDVFDHVGGALVDRRPLVRVPAERGMPDGLTVDSEGGVWVALWGGGAVHRYTASGVLDHVVSLPVTQVSACTFGGDELDVLYVTTSRVGLAGDDQPEAGSVFAVRVGVSGLPVLPFGG
jgi:sugar lactone lactonase YvrE